MIDLIITLFVFLVAWLGLWPIIREARKAKKSKMVSQPIVQSMATAEAMESLTQLSAIVPMSDMLFAIILGRKLRCLSTLKESKVRGADAAWEDARRRYHDHRGMLAHPTAPLLLPAQENRRKKMQHACKKILHFLKKELAASPHHPDWIRAEIRRMTDIDIQLTVDGALHHARNAINVGRKGTAKQFLIKARDTLSTHPNPEEISGLRDDVIRLLEEHHIEHSISRAILPDATPKGADDGLDRMFGEKQGW